MLWNNIPVHTLDFEGNRRIGVVEYGVVTLHHGEIVSAKTRLCRPRTTLDVQESAIFHLQDEDLVQSEPLNVDWDYFVSLRKHGVLCAHHAGVESRLLRDVWPFPSESPDYVRPGKMIADWGPWMDSLRLYQIVYPELKSYQLSDLISVFRLQDRLDRYAQQYCPRTRCNYHCALYDALASACLLMCLCELKEFEGVTLEWLLAHSRLTEETTTGQGQLRF